MPCRNNYVLLVTDGAPNRLRRRLRLGGLRDRHADRVHLPGGDRGPGAQGRRDQDLRGRVLERGHQRRVRRGDEQHRQGGRHRQRASSPCARRSCAGRHRQRHLRGRPGQLQHLAGRRPRRASRGPRQRQPRAPCCSTPGSTSRAGSGNLIAYETSTGTPIDASPWPGTHTVVLQRRHRPPDFWKKRNIWTSDGTTMVQASTSTRRTGAINNKAHAQDAGAGRHRRRGRAGGPLDAGRSGA